MMWWHGGPGWGGWLVMTVMMVAFWGLLIFGGIAAWRAVNRRDAEPRQLDERSPAIRDLSPDGRPTRAHP